MKTGRSTESRGCLKLKQQSELSFLDLGLRMARIDPSRRGGMDEPRDKLGVLRKNKNLKTV